jgi:hypothetical protein
MRETSKFEPLILCPDCQIEMRLFGIESESGARDLYSFECDACGRIEARGVLVGTPPSPKITS